MKRDFLRIVLVGQGNLAWHLVRKLNQDPVKITHCVIRRKPASDFLPPNTDIQFIQSVHQIPQDTDMVILAVPDQVIPDIIKDFPQFNGMFIHTSGFTDIDLLMPCPHRGVLYPFQTFTAGVSLSWDEIPICLEVSHPKLEERLLMLALLLSSNVRWMNSEERKKLHLAGVFANNFGYALNRIAARYLTQNNIPAELLIPLIMETARKFSQSNYSSGQTGPAVREDLKTIQGHLELLKDDPAWLEIYQIISTWIIRER